MSSPILEQAPLGFIWPTIDPFLFCAHHDDAYPKGDSEMGPVDSLQGRNIGQDFAGKDGWNMYHGDVVPGFPQHPHRGFETVTLVRTGLIDHSDSLGAKARFGRGDAQWLTAGAGVVHSEMFPLVSQDESNPLELFQIWLNLPSADKMVSPYFTMLWQDAIPSHAIADEAGRVSTVTTVAGEFAGQAPPAPPPDSWAAKAESDVAIWCIKLPPSGKLELPPAREGSERMLYFFVGDTLTLADETLSEHCALRVVADATLSLQAGKDEVELLMLQGRPIGEPVAQHGPFVMNTRAEIQQAMSDYQRTRFGGWPWPSSAPVNERHLGRFAQHADGRVERRS